MGRATKRQTNTTTADHGDSLELLSLSLVLDVRHSEGERGVRQIICQDTKRRHNNKRLRGSVVAGQNIIRFDKKVRSPPPPHVSHGPLFLRPPTVDSRGLTV